MIGRLKEKGYLVLDGAMGSNLFQLGLISGDSPESWNLEHPDRVKKVHQAFVQSGSDIILTNTFGGNRHRLKLHQLENQVIELNRAAVKLARECAGDSVMVAGSIGPTGEIIEPLGSLSVKDAEAAFREQASGLAEGGIDLLWIETMSDLNELQAACNAAASTGLPFAATMSFDTAGSTMMGVSPTQFVQFMQNFPASAYGANCGVGPDQLLQTIGEMKQAGGKHLIAKGNCGIPVFQEGEIRYTGTEEVMANYAREVRNLGAELIGGCCGTTGPHLHAMFAELETHPYQPTTLEQKTQPPSNPKSKSRRRRRNSSS